MLSQFEPGIIMARLMEESVRASGGPKQPGFVPDGLLPTAAAHDSCVPLPKPVTTGRPLSDVLSTRTATRAYSQDAVPLEHLATMLAAAARGDAQDWNSEVEAGHHLRFLVLVWRVTGLTEHGPGLFEYDPNLHALSLVNSAPASDEAAALFIQQEFATAAAVITVVGGLAGALARHGGYGHRLLLMRAGAAAYRGWLAGASVGLVGSVFAGMIAKPLRDLASVYGYRDAQLFALAIGKPV